MRSSDLARLAGVTVRALRHYHQVGVLAEPPRRANGYRSYDVHDLVRVLRIKRLTSLGFALERIPELLDRTDDATDLLDDLDRELAEQLERLTRQREVIDLVRRHRAAPDVDPGLAPFLAGVIGADATPDEARWGRDQSVLLAHLVGEAGLPQLAAFYARLAEPTMASETAAVSRAFDALGADTADREVTDLLDRFVALLGPAVLELTHAEPPLDLDRHGHLLAEYGAGFLNPRQLAFLTAFERRMDELVSAGTHDDGPDGSGDGSADGSVRGPVDGS